MSKAQTNAEQSLLATVATMTADEADALATSQAAEYRKAQGNADAALFGPAVTLARLIDLGTVRDGRAKKDEAGESFGKWGERHGYAGSTVTLLRTLGRVVAHGITPATDPEGWAAAVQKGTNKAVTEAFAANPGKTNSSKARKTLLAARDGNLPKTPRAANPEGQKKDETHTGITAGNVEEVVMALRKWLDVPANLGAVKDETIVTIRAHFADLAESVEAEGHRRIAAKRTSGKTANAA